MQHDFQQRILRGAAILLLLNFSSHAMGEDKAATEPVKAAAEAATEPVKAAATTPAAEAAKSPAPAADQASKETVATKSEGVIDTKSPEQNTPPTEAKAQSVPGANPPKPDAAKVSEETNQVTPTPLTSPVVSQPSSTTTDQATTSTTTSPPSKAPTGFTFGFSPVFKPEVSEKLGNSLSRGFDIGLRFSPYTMLSLRWASETLPSLGLPDGTRVLRPSHTLVGLLVGGDIPVTGPKFLAGGIQFIIPVGLITYLNWISARGPAYTSMGFDLYAGGGLRFNVSKTLFFQVAGMYHLGISLLGLERTSTGVGINTSTGESISGSTTGFELRSGITVMFN